MPPKSERPLRRSTLNLFAEDCVYMANRYGRGWTEQVRELLHRQIMRQQLEDEDWETGDPL